MLTTIWRAAAGWQRRRRLEQIRRTFAETGFPVDHMDDKHIEAALTAGGVLPLEDVPVTPRAIYFAERRFKRSAKRMRQ